MGGLYQRWFTVKRLPFIHHAHEPVHLIEQAAAVLLGVEYPYNHVAIATSGVNEGIHIVEEMRV